MNLTKRQMLRYWKIAVNSSMHVWSYRRQPKFRLAQTVQIVKKEPDLGSWTYMDACRKERKGEKGIIVDIDALPDNDVPEKYSNYTYRVMFKDGRHICFSEEHLMKVR